MNISSHVRVKLVIRERKEPKAKLEIRYGHILFGETLNISGKTNIVIPYRSYDVNSA